MTRTDFAPTIKTICLLRKRRAIKTKNKYKSTRCNFFEDGGVGEESFLFKESFFPRKNIIYYLFHFSKLVDKTFGFIPTEAGVGDRFTVDIFTDFLSTVFDIAFYHKALKELFDIGG